MTENNQAQSNILSVEMRRQMKSGQMKRFIESLPMFGVDPSMPASFQKLLARLDRPCTYRK